MADQEDLGFDMFVRSTHLESQCSRAQECRECTDYEQAESRLHTGVERSVHAGGVSASALGL